jgi:hypothetical protein
MAPLLERKKGAGATIERDWRDDERQQAGSLHTEG